MNVLKLNKICTNITDGKHGDCAHSSDSDCYFISAKDIVDNKIDYIKARKIVEDDYLEANKRTQLEINDILITNSGTIGKMALIKSIPHPTTFQKSVAILKPNPKLINPKYLYYYLLANREHVVSLAQGSTQLNLLLKDIRNIEITIPTEIHQQHIVNITQELEIYAI